MSTTNIIAQFFTLVLIGVALLLCACKSQTVGSLSNVRLWYNQPADKWMTQALPIGNGNVGAMIFGGVEKEHIQFNEKSLWSGKPHVDSQPAFRDKMPEVMELLAKGKVVEGNELLEGAETPSREFFGAFQPFGDVFIEFNHKGEVTDYQRELDLSRSLATVSYKVNGINYRREYFVSYPDQVVVMRLSADRPGKISVQVSKTCPHEGSTAQAINDTDLVLKGQMPESGINYGSRLRIINQGGTITTVNEGLRVKNANSIRLLLSAKTDYDMNWPSCQSEVNPHKIVQKQVDAASEKTYEKLLSTHFNDYQRLFHRVSLSLESPAERFRLPTDQRLIAYTNANEQGASNGGDPGLEALLFNYGRYLIISSSREGGLPANLQGAWNNSKTPAWDSDYHTDINLQMNYWLTSSTNLSECFSPFADYVYFLRKPGSEIAKNYFNARGFFINIYTNPWGYAKPRWLWPGAGGWLCQNLYDHFLFTGDVSYLKNKAFPIMKDACLFYLDLLVSYTDGSLVITPSLSPEVNFVHVNGNSYRLSAGASIDQQVVYDLFTNTIEAAKILETEHELIEKLTERLKRLSPPVKVRDNEAIQEWVEDWPAEDPEHRHISHLYALYPGRLIDPVKTPQWAKAAGKSLEIRGKDHTEWGSAWRIACYARLGQGEMAYDFFKTILRHTEDTNIVYRGGGGAYENLLTCHSPFQIDGNFGFTAAVAEMLLQSHVGSWEQGYQIQLLPALPNNWKSGEVKGLRARGGFIIDMKWESGELISVRVFSEKGGDANLTYRGEEISFETEKGMEYFPLEEGKSIW